MNVTPPFRSSMCTRMLNTILPSPYSNQNWSDVLDGLSADLKDLYWKGINVSQRYLNKNNLPPKNTNNMVQYTVFLVIHPCRGVAGIPAKSEVKCNELPYFFRFVVIAVKGDWPFLRQAMGLSRGYNCTKKCHRCDVEDSRSKIIRSTMFKHFCLMRERYSHEIFQPNRKNKEWWDVKDTMKNLPSDHDPGNIFKDDWYSPLRSLPTGDCPKYIRIDPAHTFAIDGIGKSYLGSAIVLLMHMGWFGNGNKDEKFAYAFSRFISWCEAHGKNTSITEFSYASLKLPQNSFLVHHLIL